MLDVALRDGVDEFRRHVTKVETSFIEVQDMAAEEGIRHLDGLKRDLAQHYMALSDQVGSALREELGWLPGEGQEG